MSIGLVGRKSGMTRVFTEEGNSVPVTVVEVQPNRVTQIKTPETDGYSAIQVTSGARKTSRVSKAAAGHFAKAKTEAGDGLWEFRTTELEEIELGSEIKVDRFEAGQKVDVTGTSKGKGFQGGVKRHNFRMQDATHGNSISHRAPGSIGQCQTPGKVWKGKKMAGQMGNVRNTVQSLEVVQVDTENNLLLIKGAVPGATGSSVIVKPAIKARGQLSMELALALPGKKKAGKEKISLSDESFGREYNEPLVHQTVVTYLAGARQGSVKQKNRSEVRGGGRKPWRQKGTGRARAGTIRSPIWRSGGVTFAARPQDHSKKLNKKMYRGAMQCILSELIRQDRLIVVNEFTVDSHKTKDLVNRLKEFDLDNVLIVSDQVEQNLYLAARNLHKVDALDVSGLDPVSLIGFEKVLITVPALKKVEEMLS